MLTVFHLLIWFLCKQKDVVFVRGARTPFVTSGGEFNDYMAYDLQVLQILPLLALYSTLLPHNFLSRPAVCCPHCEFR